MQIIQIWDPTLYCSVVGALQYATLTHPDVSYAVKFLNSWLNPWTLTGLLLIGFYSILKALSW